MQAAVQAMIDAGKKEVTDHLTTEFKKAMDEAEKIKKAKDKAEKARFKAEIVKDITKIVKSITKKPTKTMKSNK